MDRHVEPAGVFNTPKVQYLAPGGREFQRLPRWRALDLPRRGDNTGVCGVDPVDVSVNFTNTRTRVRRPVPQRSGPNRRVRELSPSSVSSRPALWNSPQRSGTSPAGQTCGGPGPGLTSVMCALPWMLSVMRPAALPVNVRGSWPRSASAIASRAEETSSPRLRRASRLTGSGRVETSAARSQSSSVVSPMAETTATTRNPSSRVLAIRSAARTIPAASANDEPPNFCTMTLPGGIARSDFCNSPPFAAVGLTVPISLPEIWFSLASGLVPQHGTPVCGWSFGCRQGVRQQVPRPPALRSQTLRRRREDRAPSAIPRGG